MNASKLIMYETKTWLDMERYGYGEVMSHTGTKIFLPLIKTWAATFFFLTLMNTTELYSWCSVWVKNKGIQLIGKTIGSVWGMCQQIGQNSKLWMVRYMTEIKSIM
jgi:hypothetical protein